MNSQVTTPVVELAPLTLAGRLSDYIQLVRPKIAAMVLATPLLGMFLANRSPDAFPVALMLTCTALVTAGATTVKQHVDRHTDARVDLTAARQSPAARP